MKIIQFISAPLVLYILFCTVKINVLECAAMTNELYRSDNIVQYSANESLNNLEMIRDDNVTKMDYTNITNITYEISRLLVNVHNLESDCLNNFIHSILKTRHLYLGKLDILGEFYKLNPFYHKQEFVEDTFLKKFKSLIIVTDAIGFWSIHNNDLYSCIEKNHVDKNILFIKDFIQKKLLEDNINKFIIELYKIEIGDILSNNSIIQKICMEECKFSPNINFKQFYNELMVSHVFRGYEVVGIEQNTYWPAALNCDDRIEVQRMVVHKEYLGRFLPLSLEIMQIDEKAILDFPTLRARTGSFIPYHFIYYPEFGPVDFILIKQDTCEYQYNSEKVLKLKQLYDETPHPQKPIAAKSIQYYAEQGVMQAAYKYACLIRESIIEEPNNQELFLGYLKYAVDLGYSKAQFKLGMMYYTGSCVHENRKMTVELFNLAAHSNLPEAQYNLALMHEFGIEVEQDDTSAFNLYKLASMKGSVDAQYKLATFYQNGRGVNCDKQIASRLYHLAATKNHTESQYQLACLYNSGIEVSIDYNMSAQLFHLAAMKGHTESQYQLACLYNNGIGVNIDYKMSAQLFHLASVKGHIESQYRLALLYRSGKGILKNFEESARLLSLCAQQGHRESIFKLASMYRYGVGVPKDNVEAERLDALFLQITQND